MTDQEAVAVLIRGLILFSLVGLAYSGAAVFTRERHGAYGLLRLAAVAASLLFGLGSLNLWLTYRAADAMQHLTIGLFGFVGLTAIFTVGCSTWVVNRQRRGARGRVLVAQTAGGMAAFWGGFFLLLLPVLVKDVARLFG